MCDISSNDLIYRDRRAPFESHFEEASLITNVVIFAIFVSCIYGCATNFSNEFTNMSLSYIYLTQARVHKTTSLPTIYDTPSVEP